MQFRALLAQREFRYLWMGQVWSQLGDRLTQLIVIALVGLREPGSAKALAAMLAFTVLPAFLVSPVAGAYVDRWDRRRTMLVCDVARAIGVAALAAAAGRASLVPASGLVFLLFAIACFFLPARLALVPSLVAPEALVAANSLLTTTGMIAAAASLVVGGFLVEQVGVAASCLVAAACYLASAGCVLQIHHQPPRTTVSGRRLLVEILEGLRYAVSQRHAQFVLGALVLVMTAGGLVFVIGTILVQQAMGTVTRDLGIFSVAVSLGLFLGTVAYGRWGQRWAKPPLILTCLGAAGLCLAGFAWGLGVAQSWAAGWLTMLGLGAVAAPVGIAVNAMIHELVEHRLQGRIFSAMGIVINAGLLFGLGVAGATAERLTPAGALLMVAAGLLVISGAAGLVRVVRRGIMTP